jgi:hypothetical protein
LNYENNLNNSFVRLRFDGRWMFPFGKSAGQGESDNAQSEFEIRCRTFAAGDSQSRGREKAGRGLSRAQRGTALAMDFRTARKKRPNEFKREARAARCAAVALSFSRGRRAGLLQSKKARAAGKRAAPEDI